MKKSLVDFWNRYGFRVAVQREWATRVVYSPVTTIDGKRTPAGVQLVKQRRAPNGDLQYREVTQDEYDEWAERMER